MGGGLSLFVYGTLRPGQAAAGLIGPIDRCAPGVLASARLYDTGLGWPIAVQSAPGEVVEGDVVWPALGGRSEASLFEALDDYEECDNRSGAASLYWRQHCTVTVAGDGEVASWTYLSSLERLRARYPGAQPRRLALGRWPDAAC